MTEWAQLRAGPTSITGLERGVWYRVEERRPGRFIQLLGPDAVATSLHYDAVRIIDHPPDMVTRIQETEFHPVRPGEPSPPLSYYGMCPRGHCIRSLQGNEPEVTCPQCARTYRVEDEDVT